MKLAAYLLLLVLAPPGASGGATESHGCRGAKASEAAPSPSKDAPPSKEAVFASEIRPILVAHCAPCHEPGGKLYAKLPFDDSAVLSSHEPGVKKRLKGDDLKAFERWLAMPPPARE
jgi:mono/diheme cytochrome c family protein